MFYGLRSEMWPKSSHVHLALLARERKSSSNTVCVSKYVRASVACFSPISSTLPYPFWTLLSPGILLTIKLKSFWVGIRMILLLRRIVNTGRFSVKISFCLKIWNSFALLTLFQLWWDVNTTPGCYYSQLSYFWLCNTFSSLFL